VKPSRREKSFIATGQIYRSIYTER